MNYKKIISILVLTVLFLLSLFSCGGDKSKNETRKVFRYNEMAGISSLDPAAARNFENIWPVNQIFNGLVQMNDVLQVEPSIAKSWKISEDGKSYTFTLRNDVYFHDDALFVNGKGRKVIAADFVYSFTRLFDAKVSSAMSLLEVVDQSQSGGFGAPNDTTFVIYLKENFSPFLGILTMKYFSVVPKEVVAKYGEDFRKHPVGTGPFKFKMWEEGTQLVLLKNENYFETDP